MWNLKRYLKKLYYYNLGNTTSLQSWLYNLIPDGQPSYDLEFKLQVLSLLSYLL